MPDAEYLTIEHLTTREIAAIFSRINVSAQGCWEWQGTTVKGGYGRISIRGGHELAHRLLYAWAVEPVPKGRGKDVPNLDHVVCDNPPCCNPAHVKLGPAKANTLRGRGFSAVNARKTHCIRGHLLPTEPNDRKKKKRYCKTCAAEPNKLRVTDPEVRAKYLAYMKEYSRKRRAG